MSQSDSNAHAQSFAERLHKMLPPLPPTHKPVVPLTHRGETQFMTPAKYDPHAFPHDTVAHR
jgi:hypothetical protein